MPYGHSAICLCGGSVSESIRTIAHHLRAIPDGYAVGGRIPIISLAGATGNGGMASNSNAIPAVAIHICIRSQCDGVIAFGTGSYTGCQSYIPGSPVIIIIGPSIGSTYIFSIHAIEVYSTCSITNFNGDKATTVPSHDRRNLLPITPKGIAGSIAGMVCIGYLPPNFTIGIHIP